ncbi:MAG: CTP synthetase [Halolamina sp.]
MTDDEPAPAPDAVLHGPDDHDLAGALEAADIDVARLVGPTDADALREAGVEAASYLVLTDVDEAAAIPVAKELSSGVTAVVYDGERLPEYVAGVADIAVDPALLDATAVAEELA